MLLALVLLVFSGLSWTAIGCIVSKCSHSGGDYDVVQGWYATAVGVIAALLLACSGILPASMHSTVACPTDLRSALLIGMLSFGSGVFNYLVFVFTGKAMAIGHTGLTWAMMQSSLISTFLLGIIAFGEKPTTAKILGIALIVIGLFLMSTAKNTNSSTQLKGQGTKWLLLTITALLLSMITQCLAALPSFLHDVAETSTSYRTMTNNFGMTVTFIVVMLCKPQLRRLPTRTEALFITILTVFGLATGFFIFYHALDMLQPYNLTGIGYPIALGVCIVGVELYSVFFTKEKTPAMGWAGIVSAIAGIASLAMS